jgi:hypothetical protein
VFEATVFCGTSGRVSLASSFVFNSAVFSSSEGSLELFSFFVQPRSRLIFEFKPFIMNSQGLKSKYQLTLIIKHHRYQIGFIRRITYASVTVSGGTVSGVFMLCDTFRSALLKQRRSSALFSAAES